MPLGYDDKFRQFDPNDNGSTPWATYIPGRSGPAFRTHSSRRQALSSFSGHRDHAKLFTWNNGRWELVACKDRDTEHCKCGSCGGPTHAPVGGPHAPGRWYSRPVTAHGDSVRNFRDTEATHSDHGQYVYRRNKGKIADQIEILYVCETCRPMF